MILEVDNFGNVTKSVSIGYPRRTHAFGEQGKTLITYTETAYINRSDDPTFYRIGVPYEVRVYEMTGIAPAGTDVLGLPEILTAAENAEEILYEQEPTDSIQKRLIEHTRTLYYEHNFSGPLPLGEIDSLGLPYRTYQVAFTPGLLTQVYGGRVTADRRSGFMVTILTVS